MKRTLYMLITLMMTAMSASAQDTDKTIIVTSDWHLSDERSFEPGCYYAWTDGNRERITKYLNKLIEKKDTWDVLVLDGDIFEFWRSPVDKYMVADKEGNALTDVQYLSKIKDSNREIFKGLENLHAEGKEIVYLPGNHDLNVTKEEVEEAFPGLFTCCFDTKATGIYFPFGEASAVAIEHGNRYEYFNAPYPHGDLGTEGVESYSTLPPGYFTAKLDASSTVYKASQKKVSAAKTNIQNNIMATGEDTDENNRTLVASFWNAIHAGVGSPEFTVKTGFDGIKDPCAWKDYAVSATNNPKLFKDSWTVANWKKHCELNKVPVYLPLSTSLLSAAFMDIFDDVAFTERLCNEQLPTLICVWGHSHIKRLQTRHNNTKGDVIYLNDGAWVDSTSVCTYGVIRYTANTHQYAVELRQYDADGKDTRLDCRYLYVPENNVTKLADGTWQFNAKASLVSPEDAPTGIFTVLSQEEKPKKNIGYYNLNGQQLSTPSVGINIINGRKVVIRSSDIRLND